MPSAMSYDLQVFLPWEWRQFATKYVTFLCNEICILYFVYPMLRLFIIILYLQILCIANVPQR
uniref:Uncharacterized protein n=1 Tax=Ascaris lumbricoides TaxID=6252 RepID=A0A9J2Q0L6_ASCLU